MDRPGRPSLYEPAFAEQAFELCLAGATNQDLAATFEVGPQHDRQLAAETPRIRPVGEAGTRSPPGSCSTAASRCRCPRRCTSRRMFGPAPSGCATAVRSNGATAPSRRRTRNRGGAPWPRRPSRRVLPPRPKLQDQPRWTLLQDTRSPSWRAMRLSTKRFGNVVASRF
jgi:hypothetical protein